MKPEIEMLTQLGSEAVQAAVAEYTKWFLVHAIVWMAFGVALLILARWLWCAGSKRKDADGFMTLRIAALVVAFFGALTFPVNLPDAFSPRAYAIHQLIKDARGEK